MPYVLWQWYGKIGARQQLADQGWRLPDLGSHLLDTCRFWFGNDLEEFKLIAAHRFENLALIILLLASEKNLPRIELK